MRSLTFSFEGALNTGFEEMVTINEIDIVASKLKSKMVRVHLKLKSRSAVSGRNSENALIRHELNWYREVDLNSGPRNTNDWIGQVNPPLSSE